MVCGARMQIFPHPSQFLSLRETGRWVNADLRGKGRRARGLLGNADLINPQFRGILLRGVGLSGRIRRRSLLPRLLGRGRYDFRLTSRRAFLHTDGSPGNH